MLRSPAPERSPSASLPDPAGQDTVTDTGKDSVTDSVAFPIDGPDEKQPLPPGTVRVRMTLTGVERDSAKALLAARIGTVLGYGSSTGPLAAGEEIRIRATSEVQASDTGLATLEEGMTVTAILSQAQGMVLGGERPAEWNLVEWKSEEE